MRGNDLTPRKSAVFVGLMRERDVTSTIREFAEGIYVGSAMDIRLGATGVDVRRLPESPWKVGDINQSLVDMYMLAIEDALREGEVFIYCTYGVNRAPTIAKLYCIGAGLTFNWVGSFPNHTWREFTRKNYNYYENRCWDNG